MKWKLVIFDLDGTLLDTLEDLKNSVNHCLFLENMKERTKEEIRGFVGNGILHLIEKSVPDGTSLEKCLEVHHAFCSYYREHCEDATKPYQGIPELLCHLKEKCVLLAVVSNKADFAVKKLCSTFFHSQFEAVFGEREGVRRKPEPDLILAVLKELSVAKEDTVYVGDSEVDIQTAKKAGIHCISVTWGFREREFLHECGAEKLADSPYQLLSILSEEG